MIGTGSDAAVDRRPPDAKPAAVFSEPSARLADSSDKLHTPLRAPLSLSPQHHSLAALFAQPAPPPAASTSRAEVARPSIRATLSTNDNYVKPQQIWTPRGMETRIESSARLAQEKRTARPVHPGLQTIGDEQGSADPISGSVPPRHYDHNIRLTLQSPLEHQCDLGDDDERTSLPVGSGKAIPKVETKASRAASLVSARLEGYSSPGVKIAV